MDDQDLTSFDSPLSWLELDRARLLHNLAGVRALVGTTRIMPVIKANAYGAGAVGMAHVLSQAGVKALGVGIVSEGIELRASGIAGTILCCYGPNCLEAQGRNKWRAADIENGLHPSRYSP